MVYNGYYKVMSNIPKMGQLPTPDSYEPNHHDRMGWGFLIAQIGVAAENTPKKRPLKLSESPKLWSATEDAVVGRTRTFAEGDDSRQGGQAWEGAELPCQSIPRSQPAVSFFLEPRIFLGDEFIHMGKWLEVPEEVIALLIWTNCTRPRGHSARLIAFWCWYARDYTSFRIVGSSHLRCLFHLCSMSDSISPGATPNLAQNSLWKSKPWNH